MSIRFVSFMIVLRMKTMSMKHTMLIFMEEIDHSKLFRISDMLGLIIFTEILIIGSIGFLTVMKKMKVKLYWICLTTILSR